MKAIRVQAQVSAALAYATPLGNTSLPSSQNGYYRLVSDVSMFVKFGTSTFSITANDYTLIVTPEGVIVYTDQPDFDALPTGSGGTISVEGLEAL